MTLRIPQNIPVWQRIVGSIVALALIYFLYRGGNGGIAGTLITVCMLFFVRSLYKSGALSSTALLREDSALISRSIVRDMSIAIALWALSILWSIAGAVLVKSQILADSYFSAALIFGPALTFMFYGSFLALRVFNSFMLGRRR